MLSKKKLIKANFLYLLFLYNRIEHLNSSFKGELKSRLKKKEILNKISNNEKDPLVILFTN